MRRALDGIAMFLPQRLAPALWVLPLALVISCSDMPNAPKKMVHVQGTILDKAGQPMFAVSVYFFESSGSDRRHFH